jgi:sphinganine-1-phosphate aldolase
MSGFPYSDEYEVHRTMPEEGTDKRSILAMMSDLSSRENHVWESGQCSGTMYCGDHDHYDF